MKLLHFAILLLCCQSLPAANVTLTATNCVNGVNNGSLSISITPDAYPPFTISVKGPNGYTWGINNWLTFSYIVTNLRAGTYSVSVTNKIGCIATGSIQILSCNSVGGDELPNIVLCTDHDMVDDSSGVFFLTSPSNIRYGGAETDVEFRLVSPNPLDPILQDLALTKGIQSVYDIQLNGETPFDIPFQEDILDESLSLIIKFTATGEICWVYHQERAPLTPENLQGRLLAGLEGASEQEQPSYILECKVSPNPFVNTLDVQLNTPTDGPITLQLLDLHGKLVQQSTVHCAGGTVTRQTLTPNLDAGIYVLKALDTSGKSVAVKVIKI